MGALSLSDYQDVHIDAPWGPICGRWYGKRDVRPILAIHGLMDSLGTFDTLIPLLPDYLGILCLELPGHGRSAPLPLGVVYDYNDLVLIIARTMKAYKWTTVSLMGHSLGALLSFLHTAMAPHTVDMVISLDIAQPPKYIEPRLDRLATKIDKFIVADARVNHWLEPPSYTAEQLRKMIYLGTGKSVLPEFAHHIARRNVQPSRLFPDKFYFSRDARTRFYNAYSDELGLAAELARRIKNTPYLIIKASPSLYVNERSRESLDILAAQNKHFELHEIPGTHHIHLCKAEECAKYIVPFILRHRPPTMSGWSLPPEESEARIPSRL